MIDERATGARPAAHPSVKTDGVGVLLVNLGTPAAPTAPAVRRYLAEFLADRRVVDYPRWLWLPLLHGVVLNIRPQRSARAYAKIWTADGSPLRVFTKAAAEALAGRLAGRARRADVRVANFRVDWAMRYGEPSIRRRIDALRAAGARRILVVPMYPQYSRSTVGSVEDAALGTPDVAVARPFHDDPLYIAALKARAAAHLSSLGWAPERVVLSFHGAPKRWSGDGDPYEDQCRETARLIRAAMGWTDAFAPLAFQSRFGREEWLSPATDATIRDLAAKGVRRLAVMTPGFFADCLETLDEIAIVGAATFRAAGGENFAAIPCLNDSPSAIDLLEALTLREAAGWI
jgi:ferrochelatase